ncbi:hypothetical protein N7540_012670 [Penicillium herquei]|nr:hypothetical protein N7540_012670 [Penicillium herquei]
MSFVVPGTIISNTNSESYPAIQNEIHRHLYLLVASQIRFGNTPHHHYLVALPYPRQASLPTARRFYHFFSCTIPPSSVLASIYSAIPTRSWAFIAAAGSSQAAKTELNTDFFDYVYLNYGCDWMQNSYMGNSTYCGYSPYQAGHTFSDGNMIMAVSKNGTGDFVSQAGKQCCKVLTRDPCKYGEKYLECQAF